MICENVPTLSMQKRNNITSYENGSKPETRHLFLLPWWAKHYLRAYCVLDTWFIYDAKYFLCSTSPKTSFSLLSVALALTPMHILWTFWCIPAVPVPSHLHPHTQLQKVLLPNGPQQARCGRVSSPREHSLNSEFQELVYKYPSSPAPFVG